MVKSPAVKSTANRQHHRPELVPSLDAEQVGAAIAAPCDVKAPQGLPGLREQRLVPPPFDDRGCDALLQRPVLVPAGPRPTSTPHYPASTASSDSQSNASMVLGSAGSATKPSTSCTAPRRPTSPQRNPRRRRLTHADNEGRGATAALESSEVWLLGHPKSHREGSADASRTGRKLRRRR